MGKKKNDTIDIDNFLAEILGEGKSFKLYGKTWTLQPEIPASLMLRLQTDDNVSDAEELELFRQLLKPASQFDDLLALGLGAVAFETIIRVALGTYAGVTPDEVLAQIREEKTAGAEKKAETTSETVSPE